MAAKEITPTASKVPTDLAGTWNLPGKIFLDTAFGRMVVTGSILFENGKSTTITNCKLPNQTIIAKASVPATYGVGRVSHEAENSNVVVEGSIVCEVSVEPGELKYEVRGNSLILTDLETGETISATR